MPDHHDRGRDQMEAVPDAPADPAAELAECVAAHPANGIGGHDHYDHDDDDEPRAVRDDDGSITVLRYGHVVLGDGPEHSGRLVTSRDL